MRLSVTHTTRYVFSEPVVHALQRIRLTPKITQGQEIIRWDVAVENAQVELDGRALTALLDDGRLQRRRVRRSPGGEHHEASFRGKTLGDSPAHTPTDTDR